MLLHLPTDSRKQTVRMRLLVSSLFFALDFFLIVGILVNNNGDAPATNGEVIEEVVSPDTLGEFNTFLSVHPLIIHFLSVNSHDFFVMVTLLWSEHIKTTR